MKSKTMLSIILACCCLAISARAAVVTIYFAGTNMDSGMWDGEKSKFGKPETVATLYHFQKTGPDQYKYFVSGLTGSVINWTPEPSDWEHQNKLAADFVENYGLPACTGCYTFNLVGFSRGGVSALYFSDWLFTRSSQYTLDSIKKVNVLAFDPVPGDPGMSGQWFNLHPNVDYIGFYANDERSAGFSPIFPALPANDPSSPQIKFFKVPGSHETMVGSTYKNGHWEYPGVDDRLSAVSRTLRTVATEILGSSDWGHVRFDNSLDWYAGETDISVLRQRFVDGLNDIYDSGIDYRSMREASHVAGPFFNLLASWHDHVLNPWAENECRPASTDEARDHARCAYYRTHYSNDNIGEGNKSLWDVPGFGAQGDARLNAINDAGEYAIWDLIAPGPIPEPSSFALLGLGVAGLAAMRRRKQ